MNQTKLIELIITTERIGKGIKGDPTRLSEQLWTKDGKLVATRDINLDENGEMDGYNMFFNPEVIN